MKKLLAIIVLGLLWSNASIGSEQRWNNYISAYYDGHNKCRKEWSAIGNFSSNPKILLDIESCALDKDASALRELGKLSKPMVMIKLIDKKHAEVFKAAKEASIDIISQGNVESNLKRFLKKRKAILDRNHNIQKMIYLDQ